MSGNSMKSRLGSAAVAAVTPGSDTVSMDFPTPVAASQDCAVFHVGANTVATMTRYTS